MAADSGAVWFQGVGAAGAALALDSTADIYTFTIPEPCYVYEIGVTCTVASAANNVIVKFDKRPTAGSDSGRGDGDVGSITASAMVAGSVYRAFVGVALAKGDQVVVEVTNAGAASAAGVPFMKVYPSGQSAAETGDVAS